MITKTKFKIQGYLNKQNKVDCSFTRLAGNNYIPVCAEGNLLDLIHIEAIIEDVESIDLIVDLLNRTKRYFIKKDELNVNDYQAMQDGGGI